MNLAYEPAQITAFWSGVTGITAVITGSVAILTFLSVRRDSRDRTRPVMVAYLAPVVLAPGTMELWVKNVGKSVAYNVQVTFSPPITEETGVMAGFLVRRFGQSIPTFAPGMSITNIYAHFRQDGSGHPDEAVPEEFVISFAYSDSRGHSYGDKYQLSVATLRNATTSNPSDTSDPTEPRRVVRALEAIARGVGRR